MNPRYCTGCGIATGHIPSSVCRGYPSCTEDAMSNVIRQEPANHQSVWIDIKERLPQPLRPVLGYTIWNQWIVVHFSEKRGWVNDETGTTFDGGVTHWLPLPKAPQ